MLTSKRIALALSVALGASLGLGFIAPADVAPNDAKRGAELSSAQQLGSRAIEAGTTVDDREIRVGSGKSAGRYCIDGLGTVSWASIDNHLDRLLEQAREGAGTRHPRLCGR